MSEVEVIAAVVLSHLTAGVGGVAAAPLKAIAGEFEERVRGRLRRIGANAADKADGRPLETPDRVVYKVLTEGGYADDEIVADYLGGILAASTREDDGAAVVALVGRLSSLQLRLHYLVYREVRRLLIGTDTNLYDSREQVASEVEMVGSEVLAVLRSRSPDSIGSGLAVLYREGLLSNYRLTPTQDETRFRLFARPTGLGAETFLWGHGVREIEAGRVFSPATRMTFLTEVEPTPSTKLANSAVTDDVSPQVGDS